MVFVLIAGDIKTNTIGWRDNRTLFVPVTPATTLETQLLAIDINNAANRTVVTTLPVGVKLRTTMVPGLRLSLNREGTAVLTSVVRYEGDIWMLDNFLPPPSGWRRWFGLR